MVIRTAEYFLYQLGKLYRPLGRFVCHELKVDGRSWLRHSVYFKHNLFGISDIDITYLGGQPGIIVEKYKNLKKMLPVLGEVNFFNDRTVKYIERCHNDLELQRDPELYKLLHMDSFLSKEVTAIVYLLRCLQSDRKNLKRWPRMRVRKWKHHLKSVENYLAIKLDGSQFAALGKISKGEIVFNEKIYSNSTLYPHVWMQDKYKSEDFKLLSSEVALKAELFQDVFIGQLAFEFCGVLTQLPMIEDKESIQIHFHNIILLLSQLKNKNASKLTFIITSFQKEEFQNL